MTLKVGEREVHIEAFHCRRAYMGVLGGSSIQSINAGVLKRAPRRAKSIFGCDRIHLIDPSKDWNEFEQDSHSLPRWEVYVLLRSDWTPTDEYDGSRLIVIVYADEILNKEFLNFLAGSLSSIDWESSAEPFLIDEIGAYGGIMFGPR